MRRMDPAMARGTLRPRRAPGPGPTSLRRQSQNGGFVTRRRNSNRGYRRPAPLDSTPHAAAALPQPRWRSRRTREPTSGRLRWPATSSPQHTARVALDATQKQIARSGVNTIPTFAEMEPPSGCLGTGTDCSRPVQECAQPFADLIDSHKRYRARARPRAQLAPPRLV